MIYLEFPRDPVLAPKADQILKLLVTTMKGVNQCDPMIRHQLGQLPGQRSSKPFSRLQKDSTIDAYAKEFMSFICMVRALSSYPIDRLYEIAMNN